MPKLKHPDMNSLFQRGTKGEENLDEDSCPERGYVSSSIESPLPARQIGSDLRDLVPPKPELSLLEGRKNVKSRNFHVSLQFTLEEAQKDPSAASWTTTDMVHSFQISKGPGSARTGSLKKGIIMGIKLVQSYVQSPVSFVVKMTGLRGNLYSNKNLRGVHVFLPNKGETTFYEGGHPIHMVNPELLKLVDNEHSSLDPEELRDGIVPIDSGPDGFSFVKHDHYIIDLLKRPKNLEKLEMKEEDLIPSKGYIKLPNNVIELCINAVVKKIISPAPYTDLSNFTVSLQRADSRAFNDPEGLGVYQADGSVTERLLSKTPISIEFEMYMEYALFERKGSQKANGEKM